MKIGILTGNSPEYEPLADITNPAWEHYCEKHGYEFVAESWGPECGHLGWYKMERLRVLLPRFDILMWVGCDTLPTNPHRNIEGFSALFNPWHILLPIDLFGINSDVMIYKSTPVSDMFLEAVCGPGRVLYQNHHWAEQEAITRFAGAQPYRDHAQPYRDHVKQVEGMNSYLNAEYGRPPSWYYNWRDGDWILHLPGMPLERRIVLAREYSRYAYT
jgi:hypothetical protein